MRGGAKRNKRIIKSDIKYEVIAVDQKGGLFKNKSIKKYGFCTVFVTLKVEQEESLWSLVFGVQIQTVLKQFVLEKQAWFVGLLKNNCYVYVCLSFCV